MLKAIILKSLVIYKKVLSPYLANGLCRYSPTCSEYAFDAISKHGVLKGIALSIQRLIRCQPLGNSGHDPIP